jgi:hypothetical protein
MKRMTKSEIEMVARLAKLDALIEAGRASPDDRLAHASVRAVLAFIECEKRAKANAAA